MTELKNRVYTFLAQQKEKVRETVLDLNQVLGRESRMRRSSTLWQVTSG